LFESEAVFRKKSGLALSLEAVAAGAMNGGAHAAPSLNQSPALPHETFQLTPTNWGFTMSNFSAAIRNLFSRKPRTSRRVPSRRNQTRPSLELLEGRVVPSTFSTFVPGTIQGQDGWSGGIGAISPSVDQAVDQTGSNAHFGVGAWHVSNDTSKGDNNGGFVGWGFSPGLSVAAGQLSSGAGADRFSATFFFRSANTVADGSNIEVDLGNTAGTDRTTFMAMTNKADGDGGFQLRMAEPNPTDAGSDFFYPTQTVATNITRGVWHRIDIQARFVDGASNDTFQVSLDGVAITNPTPGSPNLGTTAWGTFEGYNDAHGFAYQESNRLLFRSGGAPSNYGSFSDTGAQGFYIDDVSYKDWNSIAPSSILASYTATFEQAPSTVYVNANWAGTAPGADPDGSGPATGFGYDAFATIQDGLNAVAAGGTVNVAAGTYAGNVVVNKPVTLLGANYNVNPVTGTRGAETVVEPGLTSSYDTDSVFVVESSNVTIEGFTIQGSIASPAAGQSAGLTLVSGTTAYAAAGISNSSNVNTGGSAGSTTDVSDLTVENNILQDFAQFGVYGDTSDGTVSTGNFITDNVIKDIPNNGQGGYIGEGVLIYDNFYADVTGNAISNTRTGIQTGNNNLSAGTFAPSISNNTVSAYVKGIYYNLQYESASGFTIADNTITQADGSVSPAYNVGLLIQSIGSSVQSNITGNDVSGFLYGVEFAGNNTTNTVTVHGGQLSDNTYGVWATNNDYFYPANFNTTAALDGVTITGSTHAGIWVDSTSPSKTGPANTTNSANLAIGGGTTIKDGTVGLLVAGANALITGDTLNDTTFTGQSGNYITLANGAELGHTIDATGARFVGQTGGTATVAQNFAIEDKIQHAVDDGSLGFVRVKAGNVFVTPASGSIQRGVNVASSGDTVNVAAGTYVENVSVNKSLSLLGAQNGVDARTRTSVPESIMDETSNGGKTAFYVTANDVTIDGFTVQGTTNPNQFGFGILLGAGTSGGHVLNDIIQNNIVGLGLSNANAADQAVIQHNLFKNNNQPGPASGDAIYSDQFVAGGAVSNVLIDANTFTGNAGAGIDISNTDATKPYTGFTISRNTFNGNGRAIDAANLSMLTLDNLLSSGNTSGGTINNVNTLVFTGSNAGDTITASGASLSSNLVQAMALSGVKSVFLKGGTGNDTFNITADTLTSFAVNGGGSSATPTTTSVTVNGHTVSQTLPAGDAVVLNDSAVTAGTFYSIVNGVVQRQGFMPVALSNIQSLALTSTAGKDTLSITGSPAPMTTINTRGGDDVYVFGTGANSAMTINGDARGNTYHISGTGTGSVLKVNGGAAANSFMVTGTGASSGVALNGNTANDSFFIAASGNASLLSLVANGGNDLFDIGNTGTLDNIRGAVGVTGGPSGYDTLYVNDQGQTTGHTYITGATTLTRTDLAGFSISFAGMQNLQLLGGSGNDIMYLTGEAAGMSVGLYGGGGNDAFSIDVFANSGYGSVTVDGGSGSNTLFVTDFSGGAVQHRTFSNPTMGWVTTAYPKTAGGKTSIIQFNNVQATALNPDNG
jgi:hypothetical protein